MVHPMTLRVVEALRPRTIRWYVRMDGETGECAFSDLLYTRLVGGAQ